MSKEKDILKPLKSVGETFSLQDMLSFDTKDYIKMLQNKGEEFWIKEGEKKALNLFKKAAKDVPAYKEFLKVHKIDPTKIKTIKDFKNIPITTKRSIIYSTTLIHILKIYFISFMKISRIK